MIKPKKGAPMPVKKAAPMPVKKAAPMPVKKAAPSMTTPGPGGIGFPATNTNTGRTILPGPIAGTVGATGNRSALGKLVGSSPVDSNMLSHDMPNTSGGTSGQIAGIRPGASFGMPTSPPRMLSSGPSPTTNIGGSGGTSGQIAGIRPGASFSMKKGGKVNKMASGGTTKSASKRGDGIAQRGKTKGRMV
jgi:hypothetical protein